MYGHVMVVKVALFRSLTPRPPTIIETRKGSSEWLACIQISLLFSVSWQFGDGAIKRSG